jgi:hypothetical protein
MKKREFIVLLTPQKINNLYQALTIWSYDKDYGWFLVYPEKPAKVFSENLTVTNEFLRISTDIRVIGSDCFTFGESLGAYAPETLKRQVNCMIGKNRPLKLYRDEDAMSFEIGKWYSFKKKDITFEGEIESFFYCHDTGEWKAIVKEHGPIKVKDFNLRNKINYTIAEVRELIDSLTPTKEGREDAIQFAEIKQK